MTANRPVLVVAGPTASGKSALALAAGREFDGVVINADSMQIYHELRILTARPTAEDEACVPHRLYGVMPVREICSAGRWRDLALAEIAAAHGAGRLPILCGGTGLYLKALTEGLSPMPAVPDEVRDHLRRRLRTHGPAALHRELAADDPAAAARIEPGDGQRVLRALEVLAASGRKLSDWQATPAEGPPKDLRFATVLLMPPRDRLYARCDRRLETMVASGALDEVRRLIASGVDTALPALKALGVAELVRHLHGECSLDAAVAAAQQATRRYAKRQMTWFRNQIVADWVIDATYSERILDEIFSFIRQKLLTGPD